MKYSAQVWLICDWSLTNQIFGLIKVLTTMRHNRKVSGLITMKILNISTISKGPQMSSKEHEIICNILKKKFNNHIEFCNNKSSHLASKYLKLLVITQKVLFKFNINNNLGFWPISQVPLQDASLGIYGFLFLILVGNQIF